MEQKQLEKNVIYNPDEEFEVREKPRKDDYYGQYTVSKSLETINVYGFGYFEAIKIEDYVRIFGNNTVQCEYDTSLSVITQEQFAFLKANYTINYIDRTIDVVYASQNSSEDDSNIAPDEKDEIIDSMGINKL